MTTSNPDDQQEGRAADYLNDSDFALSVVYQEVLNITKMEHHKAKRVVETAIRKTEMRRFEDKIHMRLARITQAVPMSVPE